MAEAKHSPDRILDIAFAFRRSKALLAAVELDVFSVLAGAAMDCQTLARRTGVSERAARDFFDALVALGLLDRGIDGRYANTPEAACYLDRASPLHICGQLRRVDARVYLNWNALGEALVTGRPQSGAFGSGGFAALYSDPAALELFLTGMTGGSVVAGAALAATFPWSRYRSFVDVGTAQGAVAVQIADAHPQIRGGGFDLPVVQPSFEAYVRESGLSDRLCFYPGDFLVDPLPTADVLIMGRILHDWDVSTRVLLLEKAYAALPRGGALILSETLIDEERRTSVVALLASLHMMIETTGGSEATGADYKSWMEVAGFQDVSIEPLAGFQSAIIGIKAR